MMKTNNQKNTGMAQQIDVQLKELLLQELKSIRQRVTPQPVQVA